MKASVTGKMVFPCDTIWNFSETFILFLGKEAKTK
jgi:hypothetical protein